jgi:hypothetical protein
MRRLLVAIAVLSVFFACYGWFHRRFVQPARHSDAIEQMIQSLALRRPPHVTRGQWASAVAWTNNLHGNSLLPFETDAPTLAAFAERFKKKLDGEVDMTTIDWIWEEYADLTPHGAQYQRFKKIMDEEIAAVGPNDDPWGMRVP